MLKNKPWPLSCELDFWTCVTCPETKTVHCAVCLSDHIEKFMKVDSQI